MHLQVQRALVPSLGGDPATTLDEVVARLARAKVILEPLSRTIDTRSCCCIATWYMCSGTGQAQVSHMAMSSLRLCPGPGGQGICWAKGGPAADGQVCAEPAAWRCCASSPAGHITFRHSAATGGLVPRHPAASSDIAACISQHHP